MLYVLIKVLSHANAKKKTEWLKPGFQISLFHWPFSSDLMAVRRLEHLKPILNWANVCSLNILRKFDEQYLVLNWLVMRCKLRSKLAADSMIQNVG